MIRHLLLDRTHNNTTRLAVARLDTNALPKKHTQADSHKLRQQQRAGTRELLSRLWEGACPPIYHDSKGKPYLEDSQAQISVAHAYDHIAVMLSTNERVGIDIEKVQPRIRRLAARFLLPEEQTNMHEDTALPHMTACWCAKEALYKLHGRGALSFSRHMILQPFAFREEGRFVGQITKPRHKKAFIIYYVSFGNFITAYTST